MLGDSTDDHRNELTVYKKCKRVFVFYVLKGSLQRFAFQEPIPLYFKTLQIQDFS